MFFRKLSAPSVLSLLVVSASAQTITNGSFTFGIGPNGESFDYGSKIGFKRLADGFDDIASGNPRTSWGVTTSTDAFSFADEFYYYTTGISGATKTIGSNWAVYAADLDGGFKIKKSYSFAATNVVAIHTTITNASGSSLSGAYRECFDKNPSYMNAPLYAQSEYSSVDPIGGDVVGASYAGYESPAAGVGFSRPTSGGVYGPNDLGGAFEVNLGTLADGASKQFIIYYGLNDGTQSELDLRNQVYGLGATFQISNGNNAYGYYNNSTVGYQAVPEPASMIALGLGALATIRRRRKA